ncbi:MAG: hypothetical protein GDA47_00655 [Rhodospirillales bacterium]|nr:hypothetical protein [Rhodospirillales bacterium]
MDREIRSLIREVLAEELAKLGGHGAKPPREEQVSIANDRDLASFVQRLLQMSRNGETRAAIEQGRLVFRLVRAECAAAPAPVPHSPSSQRIDSQRIDRGFVSERRVDALPPGTSLLQVGKAVRFTPLGRDRLRQRGIAIERIER